VLKLAARQSRRVPRLEPQAGAAHRLPMPRRISSR